MDTAKIYHDIDGNDCTIFQMVRTEPQWAAARIQAGEGAIKQLDAYKRAIEKIDYYTTLSGESRTPMDTFTIGSILDELTKELKQDVQRGRWKESIR